MENLWVVTAAVEGWSSEGFSISAESSASLRPLQVRRLAQSAFHKLREVGPAHQGAAQMQEAEVLRGETVEPYEQAALAIAPGEGPLDDPPRRSFDSMP